MQNDIKDHTQNQWATILSQLGVDSSLLDGKHHPSPISGGKDGFRFIDKTGDGHYVDNGTFGDGFELLHLLHGWSFKTSCEEIRQALGIGGKDYTPPTQAEKEARKAAQAMEAERRAQALAIQRAEVAERAVRIWESATPTDSHPYLKKKGVVSYGLRMDGKGNLILAVRISGAITSIQYINQHGGKFFMSFGEVSGGCYFIKGTDTAIIVIVIVEGYATGASIREATGHHVLVAFNAANMVKVAREARKKCPDAIIILGGDHDLKVFESGDNKGKNKPNAGLIAAVEAAQAVGGVIALPRGKQGFSTDWNDIHAESGLDVVAAGVANALPPEIVSKLLPPHEEAQAPIHDAKIEVLPEQLPTVAKALPMNEKALSGDSMGLDSVSDDGCGDPEPFHVNEYPALPSKDDMPPQLWDIVNYAAEYAATNTSFSFTSALATLNSVCRGHIYAARSDGSIENLVTVFVLNAALSGEGKSATRGMIARPLKNIMEELQKTHRKAITEWKSAKDVIEGIIKKIKKDAVSEGIPLSQEDISRITASLLRRDNFLARKVKIMYKNK